MLQFLTKPIPISMTRPMSSANKSFLACMAHLLRGWLIAPKAIGTIPEQKTYKYTCSTRTASFTRNHRMICMRWPIPMSMQRFVQNLVNLKLSWFLPNHLYTDDKLYISVFRLEVYYLLPCANISKSVCHFPWVFSSSCSFQLSVNPTVSIDSFEPLVVFCCPPRPVITQTRIAWRWCTRHHPRPKPIHWVWSTRSTVKSRGSWIAWRWCTRHHSRPKPIHLVIQWIWSTWSTRSTWSIVSVVLLRTSWTSVDFLVSDILLRLDNVFDSHLQFIHLSWELFDLGDQLVVAFTVFLLLCCCQLRHFVAQPRKERFCTTAFLYWKN